MILSITTNQGFYIMSDKYEFDYTRWDEEIWADELEDFVPRRVFDAHIHLLDVAHLRKQSGNSAVSVRRSSDMAALQEFTGRLYPGRDTHYLALGTPVKDIDVAAHNPWCIDQVAGDPSSRLNVLVTPECGVDTIREWVGKPGVVGLKPYRIYSVTGDIAQCRIQDFLPEEQLELANELGLWVTMHLSRFHGCADEMNLADLELYAHKRYPRIRWILAHCARSFTYWPIRQAVERLRDIPNIWYDLSAVTDVRPFITLFQKEDISRIFFGSDGVEATFWHGQYTAFGRAWQAVLPIQRKMEFPHCDGRPILAVYEQMLSIKHAAEIAGLNSDALEDIFWRNATREFGIEW